METADTSSGGEVPDAQRQIKVGVDLDTAFYWEGAADRRLLAQRCASCERLWHPPSPVCPYCQALDWTVDELPDRGTVYSVVKVHQPGSPIQGSGYLVGLIEVADPTRPGEAVRIAANVRGADLDQVAVGASVRLRFEPLAGDQLLPQFEVVR